VVLFARLYALNRGKCRVFTDPEIRFVYGSLHEAYPRHYYFFENWILVRRLVVAGVAQIVDPLNLPMKFTWYVRNAHDSARCALWLCRAPSLSLSLPLLPPKAERFTRRRVSPLRLLSALLIAAFVCVVWSKG
jgi:hypothetical protein